MCAARGQGGQGPAWQGAGHLWLPHLSRRPHTCSRRGRRAREGRKMLNAGSIHGGGPQPALIITGHTALQLLQSLGRPNLPPRRAGSRRCSSAACTGAARSCAWRCSGARTARVRGTAAWRGGGVFFQASFTPDSRPRTDRGPGLGLSKHAQPLVLEGAPHPPALPTGSTSSSSPKAKSGAVPQGRLPHAYAAQQEGTERLYSPMAL